MNEQEKMYKTMGRAGMSSVIIGIVMIVTGVTAGVLTIINGARLLKRKGNVLI